MFSQVYCIHSIKFEQCEPIFFTKNKICFEAFVCVFALLPDQKKRHTSFCSMNYVIKLHKLTRHLVHIQSYLISKVHLRML